MLNLHGKYIEINCVMTTFLVMIIQNWKKKCEKEFLWVILFLLYFAKNNSHCVLLSEIDVSEGEEGNKNWILWGHIG